MGIMGAMGGHRTTLIAWLHEHVKGNAILKLSHTCLTRFSRLTYPPFNRVNDAAQHVYTSKNTSN